MRGLVHVIDRVFEAVIDMGVNQEFFCSTHGFFDGMELLRDFKARAVGFDHLDDAAGVPFRPFQAVDNLWVGRMRVCVVHLSILSPRRGCVK